MARKRSPSEPILPERCDPDSCNHYRIQPERTVVIDRTDHHNFMHEPLLELDCWHIDAFTDQVFAGNPAAVVRLDAWLDDATLAAIAAEHNLAETAFVVAGHDVHELRWFTPTCEVELCSHATLASAHVLLYCRTGFALPLRFATRYAGELGVAERDGMLWLDFPVRPAKQLAAAPSAVQHALGVPANEWLAGVNHLAVFEDAATIAALEPDMRAIADCARADNRGVIVTAPADDGVHDFVSRYFAPAFGNDEDPVTGSAHCTLAPYWGQRLGRTELAGRQISRRGGSVRCELAGDRVHLGGRAVRYAQSRIFLPSGNNRP